jgi:hypothetical protein
MQYKLRFTEEYVDFPQKWYTNDKIIQPLYSKAGFHSLRITLNDDLSYAFLEISILISRKA